MTDVLLILHVVGLMFGAAGGFGGVVSLAHARPAQKQKGGPVRGIGPVFAHMSMMGLALLWPTGIAMMVMQPAPMGAMFLMKMLFAGLVTFAAVSVEMAYARGRKGDPQIARLLPSLHPLAALSYLMAAVFSVLAFG
jgi:hypothetical protein